MPITDITSDSENLTMTVIGDYDVPVERLWQAWSDPRQIERFWGPPTYPATFTRHDMAEGGRTEYFMTGPNGERSAGYWVYESVEPGRSFTVRDGFVGDDGEANDDLPSMRIDVRFEPTATGSRFVNTTTFPSVEAMEQLIDMGMREGMEAALGQLPDVLADLASFAHDRAVDAELLSDTSIRMSRIVRGSVEQVWRAHHDADLMKQWMLGPDGWTMPVCEVAERVGETFRYEWASDDGEQRFGFEGEVLESAPPTREVATETMSGSDVAPARNELTLTPVGAGTLVTLVVTYPSTQVRDEVLASGMTDGMEMSYARLEATLDTVAA